MKIMPKYNSVNCKEATFYVTDLDSLIYLSTNNTTQTVYSLNWQGCGVVLMWDKDTSLHRSSDLSLLFSLKGNFLAVEESEVNTTDNKLAIEYSNLY